MGVLLAAIITGLLVSFPYPFIAGILADVKPSLRQIILCVVGVNIARALNIFWTQTIPVIKIFSTLAVIYAAMMLIFKRKAMSALGDTIVIAIAYGGCVMFVGFLQSALFGVKYYSTAYSVFVSTESNVFAAMSAVLLWIFYGLIFLYKKYIAVDFKRELISKSLFAIFGAYGLAFFNFVKEYEKEGDVLTINFAILLIIVALYVGTNYAISNYKLYNERQQNKSTAQQIEAMKRITEELRMFKHNYLNLLYGFGNRIEVGQIDALREYYNETVETSSRINNDNLFALDKIKVYPLYNLFLEHIAKAADLDIRFVLCVEKEFSKLPIKNNDICQILGIFLDNSREAAKTSSRKEIKVDILNGDEFLEIYTYNTFAKKDDAQLQSEKEQGRGMGLIYCDNILKKYKNILHNEYIESSYFVQQLIMEK